MSRTWYSHPPEDGSDGVLLRNHLYDVAERVEAVVSADATTSTGASLREVGRVAALVHDFGKLTPWFQHHIGMEGEPPKYEQQRHHALFGGFLAYYVLDASGADEATALAGFVAVARHHGRLPHVAEYVFERTSWTRNNERADRGKQAVIDQAQNIDAHLPDWAAALVKEATGRNGSWEEFVDTLTDEPRNQGGLIGNINGQVSHFGDNHTDELIPEGCYADTLALWSTLILADKTGAALGPGGDYGSVYDPGDVAAETVANHVAGLQDEAETTEGREHELNALRENARQDVLSNLSADTRVGTLTLPTGFGKTLTGLQAALELRDITDRERVVYALPFTSVIDQVGSELRTLFDSNGRDERLTLHHHLVDAVRELDDEAFEGSDIDARVETMVGESWRAGIVVSTFVQLFESLAAPGNTQSMKLPALCDSVVILDEPQALPLRWWPLTRKLIDLLVEEYDAAVLAMTATQPKLFDRPTTQLVSDPDRFYTAVERVEYRFDESVTEFPDGTVGYGDAARRVAGVEGPALAICNTIDSAERLTETVMETVDGVAVGELLDEELDRGEEPPTGTDIADAAERADGRPVLHLSTRLRPRDRGTLIDAAKRLTDRDVPLVAISTQLVEAGVDISFAQVFRDFGPMDSIVQAGGRCNRSFERDRGRVTVWHLDALDEDATATPAQAVYDRRGTSRLSLTKAALESVTSETAGTVPGPTVTRDAVTEYYDRVNEAAPGEHGWPELIDIADAEALGRKSLIRQRRAVEVVVCRTKVEEGLVERTREAWNRAEFTRLDDLLDRLRPLQVSVPIYRDDSPEAEAVGNLERLHGETDIRVLDASSDRYEEYFDPATGFVVPDDTVEARFL